MKKLAVLCAVCVFMTSMCLSIPTFADNGFPIEMFYDFDDYFGDWNGISTGSKALPDENWGHDGTHHRFGSLRAEDAKTPTRMPGENLAMALGSWHGTRLWLDELLNTGSLHISFDLKFVGVDEDPAQYMSMKFDKGEKSNLRDRTDVATVFRIDAGQNLFTYYAGANEANGVSTDLSAISDGSLNIADGWHRIDIYTGDLEQSSGGFKVFIDGYQVSAGGVNNKALSGIRSFFAYHQCSNDPDWTVQLRRHIMIDNLAISRFSGNITGLRGIVSGNKMIPVESGSLDVRFSEPVSASEDEINNSISISNSRTGELPKAKYSVEKLSDTKIRVNFSGNIPAGQYTLKTDSSVVGKVQGLPMGTAVDFRTEKEYVDGVVRPEIESVQYINYNGSEVSVAEGAPSTLVKIVVNFNTLVDDASAVNAIGITSDKEEPVYEVSFERNGDTETAVVSLPNLLTQETEYEFTVDEGIASEEKADVLSNYGISQGFTTKKDASFGVFENKCENGVYCVKFAKNNSASGKWTVSVASYDEVIGADGNVYKKMKSLEYAPFTLEKEDKGIFEYNLSYDQSGEEVDTYIWSWPSNITTGIYKGDTGDIK